MIVPLSYSTSWSKNNAMIPSTGGLEYNQEDSVLISYDDLRIVNSKLIELEYERQLNNNLRTINSNDSITINSLSVRYDNMVQSYERNIRTIKVKEKTLIFTNIGTIILLVLSLLK